MHFVQARGILSAKNGINPYRGCTHGCIYCDARSVCYHMTHDFEDVEVKENAPELLDRALAGKRKKCMISTGAMCDPYNACETEVRLTRRCLEVLSRRGFGAAVLTKSARVLEDLPLFQQIHKRAKCVVQMTLTTCDEALCRVIEPNVSTTRERFEALLTLRGAGIPTVVWLSPLLPFLNDTEENLRGILEMCFEAGVRGIVCFGMGLTLREGDREYFYQKLDEHFPGLKRRYAATYGNAYILPSPNERRLFSLFDELCTRRNVLHTPEEVFRDLNEFPRASLGEEQLRMF